MAQVQTTLLIPQEWTACLNFAGVLRWWQRIRKTRKHVVLTQEARYVLLKYLMLNTSYVLKTSVGPAQWGKCLPYKQEDLSSSPRTYIKWARCGTAHLYSQL